jgi:hypothetical protein
MPKRKGAEEKEGRSLLKYQQSGKRQLQPWFSPWVITVLNNNDL